MIELNETNSAIVEIVANVSLKTAKIKLQQFIISVEIVHEYTELHALCIKFDATEHEIFHIKILHEPYVECCDPNVDID